MSNSNAIELWNRSCQHLQTVLPPDIYSRWIAVIEPYDLTDNVFTLAVDNDFYQTWLEENYLPLIKNAISTVSNSQLKITFTVKPIGSKPVEPEPKKKKTIRERFSRRSRTQPTLNPKFTFDSFVIGSSNNFAHAASLAVAQAPAKAYNPLFIYGDVGLGKTHLMQAIGRYVLASSRATVCYLSSEALLNEYIAALQNRSLVQFRKKYRNTDVLLIDDIHFLADKERLQEEFFHTFNTLFDAHKQIVMTSDRPASQITGLEKRLVSRFEWGLVSELESPDLETRIAILRNKQAESQSPLSDKHITFIAKNIRSNVRRLEGAFIRLASYASLSQHELTEDKVRYLLRDTLEKERESNLTFDTIQKTVAEYFDIRFADMTSKQRPRSIALPRQIAMYLCRQMTRSSFPDIASAFGKTHATVLHACKSINERMDVDRDLKQNVVELAHKLGQELPSA